MRRASETGKQAILPGPGRTTMNNRLTSFLKVAGGLALAGPALSACDAICGACGACSAYGCCAAAGKDGCCAAAKKDGCCAAADDSDYEGCCAAAQ